MAGSISLSMSQQFKRSGAYAIPLSGGKLYTLAAGETNTPQNSYQDFGLTIAHPNPIPLDESGYIPPFYLDDGFIKIRLVDADGLTIREVDNLLVVGPSTGEGGGGGGGVDPTTVFQTGDSIWQPVSGSRTGWVRDNGRTIGSSTSGGTERANADCEALFSFLWNNYSNTFCPVEGGRGISAAADWAANKKIQLRDFTRCVPGGLDGMGNTATGDLDDVPVVTGDSTTAGSIIGEIEHELIGDELAEHDHTVFLHDDGHSHNYVQVVSGGSSISTGGGLTTIAGSVNTSVTGITLWSDGDNSGSQNKVGKTGSGTAHNNVQRTALGTFYRKL